MNRRKSKKFLEKCVEKVKEIRETEEVLKKLEIIKKRKN